MRQRGRLKVMSVFALALVVSLLLVSGSSGMAHIDESCRFHGPVTVCGENVPPGTVVSVSLDPGTGPFWTTTTFMHAGMSYYVIDIPADDPGTVDRDGGVVGDAVYFSVTYQGSVIAAPGSVWQRVGQIHHPLRLCFYMGDANMDGVIDGGDITKVQRIIWGLDPPTPTADANNDGVIDAGDITMVRLIIWGLVDPIPCC